jgi:hypothetical protein
MYRYRLVDERGDELGPFVSPRLAFQAGEEIARSNRERYEILRVIEAEMHEPFRAYLVVRAC